MIFKNNGKDPNKLLDYLILNDNKPITLEHNAIYDEEGALKQATEIYIEIEAEKKEVTIDLVNEFISH